MKKLDYNGYLNLRELEHSENRKLMSTMRWKSKKAKVDSNLLGFLTFKSSFCRIKNYNRNIQLNCE